MAYLFDWWQIRWVVYEFKWRVIVNNEKRCPIDSLHVHLFGQCSLKERLRPLNPNETSSITFSIVGNFHKILAQRLQKENQDGSNKWKTLKAFYNPNIIHLIKANLNLIKFNHKICKTNIKLFIYVHKKI